jgi:class 3 adenylate cyclase
MAEVSIHSMENHHPPTPTGEHAPSLSSKLDVSKASNSNSHAKAKILGFIEHWGFTVWMTVLTVYALFGDDVRLLATEMPADDGFYAISCVCLFFFTLEIVLGSIAKEDYWLNFFFWLDVISTVSLIPDIGWIWDPIVGGGGSAGGNAAKASQLARAGRASRAGTRAGRVIRIIRVIRLIRIVKLYKIAQEAKDSKLKGEDVKPLLRSQVAFRGSDDPCCEFVTADVTPVKYNDLDESESNGSFDFFKHYSSSHSSQRDTGLLLIGSNDKPEEPAEEEVKIPEQSKVGKKLSEMTTKRVITLVLGMMFCLPLFTNDLWLIDNNSYQFGLEIIDKFVGQPELFLKAWDLYIDEHEDLETPLIYLEVDHLIKWEADTDYDDLRPIEQELATIKGADSDYFFNSIAIFDLRPYTRLQAGLSIARTIFVCLVLSVSSIMFTKDAEELVIGPIESMVAKIRSISEDPLRAIKKEEREQVLRKIAMEENPELKEKLEVKKSKEGPMETAILEETIIKIGTLLALGFGEAGSEIIGTNIKRGGGEVDPMIPGKKTFCIFGFCDIHNFADCTEELQEGILVFVNEIAKIVHTKVDHFSGAANKNIGDAFLLVWKFPEELIVEQDGSVTVQDHPFVRQMADMALISFLKIIAAINKDPTVLKYRQDPRLLNRMPGYSVKMGFGLNVGWAIEGAIGSEFKIDASYLSPNVNLASRLEAATRQYGVPLLISGQLHSLLSNEAKKHMRRVDRVEVKGSKFPMDMYTCDCDVSKLTEDKQPEIIDKKEARVMAMIEREKLKARAWREEYNVSDFFIDDEDLFSMRSSANPDFYVVWDRALQMYTEGNWREAKELFNQCMAIKAKDGPSQTLMRYMEEHNFEAPGGWTGFRALTEK